MIKKIIKKKGNTCFFPGDGLNACDFANLRFPKK